MADEETRGSTDRGLEALASAFSGRAIEDAVLREAWDVARGTQHATVQSAYAVFSILLRHGHGDALTPGGIASWFGPLIEDATERRWSRLSTLAREPGDIAPRIQALLADEKSAAERRKRAAVSLGEMLPALRWVLPSLLVGSPVRTVEIRGAALGESGLLVGYTDGHDIYLGGTISLFERTAHNELAYLRLLVHEALHLVRGSFDATTLGKCVVEASRALGREPPDVERRPPRDLSDLCDVYGAHDRLFFGLLNMAEDARVERHFDRLAPGLAGLAEAVDAAVHELSPPNAFQDLPGQLLGAIAARLRGTHAPPIPARLHGAFVELEAEIATFRRGLHQASLLESARVASRLTLWLGTHLPLSTCKELGETLRRRRPLKPGDIRTRAELVPPGFRPRTKVRPRIDLSSRSPPLAAGGVLVEEHDFWRDVLRPPEMGASVVTRAWDPYRAGVEGRCARSLTVEALRKRAHERLFAPTGRVLEVRRFVRALADRRAGHPIDPRVFRRRAPASAETSATVLVDLSVSMVHFRPDGTRPIEHAVGIVQEICERVPNVRVLGAVDAGPHDVSLFPLKEADEPLRRSTLESIHAYALGGFRMGALLRALAFGAGAGERGQVWVVTDCGNHYVARGIAKILELDRKLCADCPGMNSYCQIEKPYPDEGWIGTHASIFEPLEYELADLRHALAATSGRLDVRAVMLGDEWSDDVCDHAWSAGRWSRV